MTTNSNYSEYNDHLREAGLSNSDLEGVTLGDIAALNQSDLEIAEDQCIKITHSTISEDLKKQAINALNPDVVKGILEEREQVVEVLTQELCEAIKFRPKDALHQSILSEVLKVCNGNPELLYEFSEIAKTCGANDPLGAVFNLTKVTKIFSEDKEKLRLFLQTVKLSGERASETIRALIKAREAYGDDKEIFAGFVAVVQVSGSKAPELIAALASAKSAYGNDKEIFAGFVAVVQVSGSKAPELIAALASAKSAYGDDKERFAVFTEIAKASHLQAPEAIDALRYAKIACGEDKERFAIFVKLAKSGGSYAPEAIVALASTIYEYGDDNEIFQGFLEIVLSNQYGAEKIIDALKEAKVVYGKDKQKFQRFLSIALKLRNSAATIKSLVRAREVYENDDESFQEMTGLALTETEENTNEIINALYSAREIYGDNKEIFLVILKAVKKAAIHLCYGIHTIKGLKVTSDLYNDDIQKLRFLIEKIFDLLNKVGLMAENDYYEVADELLVTLKNARSVYRNNWGKFIDFIEVGQVADVDCLEAIKKLYEAREVYGDDKYKFDGFVAVSKAAGPKCIKALEELITAQDIYKGVPEKFLGFIEVGQLAGQAAAVEIGSLRQLSDLYKDDIEAFRLCLECFRLGQYKEPGSVKEYIRYVRKNGRENIDQHFESIASRSKSLISSEPAPKELRNDDAYLGMLGYVFPKGEYSDYDENLACGDRTEHLNPYIFKRQGYPVQLTGLLGYNVREGSEENIELLDSYKGRLANIRKFVQSRGPHNRALQDDFRSKVDELFEQNARNEFKEIPELTLEMKLLIIFLSELLSSGTVDSRPGIRDLIIEYKYAFEVDLEGYIQRSAFDVERFNDETSQRYMLWSALSNLYGENLHHTLRHQLLGKIKGEKPFNDILEVFRTLSDADTEQDLTVEQRARIENTFSNDRIPSASRLDVLKKQLMVMFSKNITFNSGEERTRFEGRITEILEPLRDSFSQDILDKLLPSLIQLRSTYRLGLERRIEDMLRTDTNTVSREITKYSEIVESEDKESSMNGPKKAVKKSAKVRNLTSYFTKTAETANARMGAYLCIAGDSSMWENPNYFEAVMQDLDTNKCVGLIMFLNINAADGKRYLWFGPNPFEKLLGQVSSKQCFEYQYNLAVQFAQENGYDGVVVPSEESRILGECTNRGGDYPDLINAKRLREPNGKAKIVDFGTAHNLSSGYSYINGALIWEKS